jgi:hypothetical protein
MPIIENPDPALPLSQGDILKEIRLFLTRGGWTPAGGDSHKTPHKLCMVVSRPCALTHKAHAIVAAIERFTDRVPRDIETFEDIRAFLIDLRDGTESPDVFYLGQLPGYEGRYGARLDSLHTFELPEDGPTLRLFTDQKRIGKLHIDFVRDLHLRVFRAFASLGFDDHRWLSTEDLQWLVSRGRSEVNSAEADVRGAETALHSAQAQGFRSANEQQTLEKAVESARRSLTERRTRLAPYEAELAARSTQATAGRGI